MNCVNIALVIIGIFYLIATVMIVMFFPFKRRGRDGFANGSYCQKPQSGMVRDVEYQFVSPLSNYNWNPNVHNVPDSNYHIVMDMSPVINRADVLDYANFDLSDWEVKADTVASANEMSLAKSRDTPTQTLADEPTPEMLNEDAEEFSTRF